MKIEVLVATMNQTDVRLLNKMNIQTDVIVGNQCDTNEVKNFEWGGTMLNGYHLMNVV